MALSTELLPEQIVAGVAVGAIIGLFATVTNAVAIAVQPTPSVPVTVYVVVVKGLAVTLAPVVADNPVDGDQVYVCAPKAVNVIPAPPGLQISEIVGLTETGGGVQSGIEVVF